MLGSTRRISRALRVLLTCLALVTATPNATGALGHDVRAPVAVHQHSPVTSQPTSSRGVRVGVQLLRTADLNLGFPPSPATACELVLRTRCAFLLNCSWLC